MDFFTEFPAQFITETPQSPRVFAAPAGIFRLEDNTLFRYEPAATRTVQLRNLTSGAIARFEYGADGFVVPDPAGNPYLSEFAPSLYQSVATNDGIWTIGGGPHQFSLADTAGAASTLTLTATTDAPWLGIFLSASQLTEFEGQRLTAGFSGTESLLIDIHSYDFERGIPILSSHQFLLPTTGARLRQSYNFKFGASDRARDYISIVARDIKAGQEFSIHGLQLFVSDWPAELVFNPTLAPVP